MSTATQETFTGFAEATVQKLPTIACVGTVEEVGEGKLSESQMYVVQPLQIRGTGAGRNITHRILYRPEWLDQNFDPESLADQGSMQTVYRRNIAVRSGISALKGLSGSEDGFKALASKVISLPSPKTISAVQAALREFFKDDNEEVEVGYILKQRKSKAGEDENGKVIYELDNGYEVGEWFFPTAEKLKQLKQRAERTKDGSFRVAFDEDDN